MKAARVLRFGSPNVITNDDLLSRNPPSGNCWSAIVRRNSRIGHRFWNR